MGLNSQTLQKAKMEVQYDSAVTLLSMHPKGWKPASAAERDGCTAYYGTVLSS